MEQIVLSFNRSWWFAFEFDKSSALRDCGRGDCLRAKSWFLYWTGI